MSFTSTNDLSTKYLNISSSQNDASEESESVQSTDNKLSVESVEQSSIHHNRSSIQSTRTDISLISTSSQRASAMNSVDESIELSKELEDMETSTKCLQVKSDSFNSHTYSSYNQQIHSDSKETIESQPNGDLQLPLAGNYQEEQDASISVSEHNNPCTKKRFRENGDPMENLISATLAIKEASHNQCNLLEAQTNAINRLATAIEDQNFMISQFHTIVQKTNLQDNDRRLRGDK